ncbi:DUF2971 domain-containing protein [Psychrobacter aestuarii]|uniref:DUF2971 domain-containing protein n=1 Tax=Psychrobacter aestuarii TaxID=556327 RepID=A0ABP3F8K2_9GAMM|nr:DUF2971 domain-containing protein [Psychrobacter aestuarii]
MNFIGDEPNTTEPLWRYFKIDRLIDFLTTGELYFASAREFDDKFEGAVAIVSPEYKTDPRYTRTEGTEKAFEELKRLTKVSCWHRSLYESDAMWQLYADERKGVAIQTNLDKIKNSIKPFRLNPAYAEESLYFGNIKYIDLTKVRLKVSMIERFWYKHTAFDWEKEFRLGISFRLAEEFGAKVPEYGIKVKFEIVDLIECIHLGPFLLDSDIERVKKVAIEKGIGDRVHISSLKGIPRYT